MVNLWIDVTHIQKQIKQKSKLTKQEHLSIIQWMILKRKKRKKLKKLVKQKLKNYK